MFMRHKYSLQLTWIFLILLTAVFFGCSGTNGGSADGKLNGLHKYYYPEGQLYLEVHYKDSIAHGITKQYFKNGQLFEEVNYVNGAKHGIQKRYYEDGALSMETPYDSGRRHGIERKFRKDGTKAYEAPYHYDNACIGLKEYYLSGNPVEKYPEIIITPEDRLFDNFRYSLRISLSEKHKVEFFEGTLTQGKYVSADAEKIYMENSSTARIDYPLGPGEFLMKTINVIAKVKTELGNTYITQKKYNLAVENR